jgi:hypothetical protein
MSRDNENKTYAWALMTLKEAYVFSGGVTDEVATKKAICFLGGIYMQNLPLIGEENPKHPRPANAEVIKRVLAESLRELNETSKPALLDDFSKRLLMANQLGILVYAEGGHRWIDWLGCEETSNMYAPHWTNAFKQGNLLQRGKCYYSVVDALNMIDQQLQTLGRRTLLQEFEAQDGMELWGLDKDTEAMKQRDLAAGDDPHKD